MTFKSILLRVANVLKKGLVRDTLWLLFAQGFGIVLQLAGFTLIARALGVEAYGTFIGITSFASIAVPFVGLGSGDILIKHVSRSPDSPFQPLFREYWGRALLTTSISGIGLTGLSLLVVNAILPGKAAPLMIGLILLADLLFLKLWDVATKAFLAIDRVSLTARIKLFLNFNKLLAAVILFVFFRDPGLEAWAILYFASTALTGVISVLLVNQIVAPPTWRSPRLNSELLQGLYFSISASADNINASIDKTMLASLSTATAAGLYAAAYRCIDVGSVGLLALSGAAYAKFFQQGKSGIQGSLRFAKRLLPLVSAYGIAACTVFFCWLRSSLMC
ncbi:MAG: oligosaccharide flippase family protein [Cyanobacteria bacterium CRU_2_1]|nr:oligosaccharide flippase family protein [Cyanobacteria bacterium CRU_2_1]